MRKAFCNFKIDSVFKFDNVFYIYLKGRKRGKTVCDPSVQIKLVIEMEFVVLVLRLCSCFFPSLVS